MLVLLDGIYVKPLIDLMGLNCECIILVTHDYKAISRWRDSPSEMRRTLRINAEIVITKKDIKLIRTVYEITGDLETSLFHLFKD